MTIPGTARPCVPIETRQETRRLYFPPGLVEYIDWSRIGHQRRELNCDMAVTTHTDGGLTVLLFWPL